MANLQKTTSVEVNVKTSGSTMPDPTTCCAHHPSGIVTLREDGTTICCSQCELCKKEKMDTSRLITIIFLALEWILGIIVFGIEVGYEVNTLFIRYHCYHYLHSNAREYLVRARLVYTTVTAFPLIILPIVVLPMFISKRTLPSSLFILLGLIGCGCYIATGAVTLAFANLPWVPLAATQAFGILAIITGIVYLAHCAFVILRSRDDDLY